MGLDHFSYLLEGGMTHQTKMAADRLEVLAKVAAKRYLEEKVPLNDTIKKMAAENDLNSHQVERVCEMANISTHQGLWSKTAEKDKVSFPLADAKAIITKEALFAGDGGCVRDSDYAGPPKGLPTKGPELSSLMNVKPDEVHNGLGEEPDRKRIIIVIQKHAAARQMLVDKVLVQGMELETLEKKAYHEVKQALLGGESLQDLVVAATVAGFAKEAGEYFPKFQERLLKELAGPALLELEKRAIYMAPEELISDNLGNVSIANGAHPVLVSLDTIQRKTGEIRNGLRGLIRIDDEVKIYNQRLRDLSAA